MSQIVNQRLKTPVVRDYRLCDSILSKSFGLMFSRKRPDFGLIFAFSAPVRTSLHMFFVFYSIDVLYLDSSKRIVEIKRNLKPFWGYMPRNKARYIVEVVAGVASTCKVGDRLDF